MKTGSGKKSAKKDGNSGGDRKPKARRKRRVVATKYQHLMCELLRLKEEFLKRNPEYASEVQELYDELPNDENRRKWTEEDSERLWAFVSKWDTAWYPPSRLREHPYGADRMIWNEGYGVVELSGEESDLVVIGIDIRHDADEIAEYVRDLVRDVRAYRESKMEKQARWKPFRWKSEFKTLVYPQKIDRRSITRRNIHHWEGGFPEEAQEAILAWDQQNKGAPRSFIRGYLYPDSVELPPGHPGWEEVKMDEDKVEGATRKTQRRLRKAREMIEKLGYRQILPLTGMRSRVEAIRQWEVSSGIAKPGRTRKGGDSRVLGTKKEK